MADNKDNSISTTEARNQFSRLINRAAFGKERILLTRRGEELVALVPAEDLRLIEALEERMDLDDAKASLAEAAREGTVSWEKVQREAGLL